MLIDKVPPHDLEAEEAIIGAVLVDPEAYTKTIGIINRDDFYSTKNCRIWDGIVKCINKNGCVDLVLICEYVPDLITDLNSIVTKIFTSANIKYHAKILKELSLKRKLNTSLFLSCDKIFNGDELDEILSSLLSNITQITSTQSSEHVSMEKVLDETLVFIKRRSQSKELSGISSGFPTLDNLTDGWQKEQLYILGARPSLGKTCLGINQFTMTAAREGHPSGVVSIEMGQKQIGLRIMSECSDIPLWKLRRGMVTPIDMDTLNMVCSQIKSLPIEWEFGAYDISKIERSIINMASKGVELIVVDYLQLANANQKGLSREREIGLISNTLKRLSKQLKISVIAIAQLNRQVESREGKKPMLADLRECLSVETSSVYYSDHVRSPLCKNGDVLSLNTKGNIEIQKSEWIPKTTNFVYRLKTESGRFVDATKEHPILTTDGFKKIKDIKTTDSVAIPIGFIDNQEKCYFEESQFIGWMLGNGSMVGSSVPSFITNDASISKEFCFFVKNKWGFVPKNHPHKCSKVFQYDLTYSPVRTSTPNIVKSWCIKHDLWGRRSFEKYIPEWFMQEADEKSIVQLLQGLWETDGTVLSGKHNCYKFATTSPKLKEQVLYLLAKLGIFAFVDGGYMSSKATTPCYQISIRDNTFREIFTKKIKLGGYKGKKQAMIKKTKHSKQSNKICLSTMGTIKKYFESLPTNIARIQTHNNKRITQVQLQKVIEGFKKFKNIKETPFDWICSKYIAWDSVESVTPIGEREVFDRNVEKNHNFIVNGIVVHNSGNIEQDADVIMFLYKNQDNHILSIAKGRNEGTGEINLSFDGDHMRFKEIKANEPF